jgi:hypothetical protein
MGQAIKCPRCRVTVDEDKLALPSRCNDKHCPLNKLLEKSDASRRA